MYTSGGITVVLVVNRIGLHVHVRQFVMRGKQLAGNYPFSSVAIYEHSPCSVVCIHKAVTVGDRMTDRPGQAGPGLENESRD